MVRALLALALLAAGACGPDSATGTTEPAATLVVHTSSGDQGFTVEIADTPQERERGLMGRDRLAPFDGMAFTWSAPVRTSFWMKDTIIPLSIAFWDERMRIVAVFDMEPCTADPCPSYDPQTEILGAVELGAGVLEQRGIEVGDRVELTGST